MSCPKCGSDDVRWAVVYVQPERIETPDTPMEPPRLWPRRDCIFLDGPPEEEEEEVKP